MARGSFRKGSRASGNKPQGFQTTNLMFKPGVQHTWIDSYLGENGATSIRVIPSFDTEGNEEIALNPEGTPDMDNEDVIGQVAYTVNVAVDVGPTNMMFATDNTHNKEGELVSSGWSPSKLVLRRMKYKLQEVKILKGAHQSVDVPGSWCAWAQRKYGIKEPSELVLVQAMCNQLNGKPITDLSTGQPKWLSPGVFAIPRSAQTVFINELKSRADVTQDLSESNNMFGDFCSLAGGRMLMLKKYKSQEKGVNFKYALKAMEPCPLDIETARAIWVPWEDIIYTPCVEEQIDLLIAAFDGAAVDYGLRDTEYDEYIPDEYRGSSKNIADGQNIKDLQQNLASQMFQHPQAGVQAPPMAPPPPPPAPPMAPPPPPPAPPAQDNIPLPPVGGSTAGPPPVAQTTVTSAVPPPPPAPPAAPQVPPPPAAPQASVPPPPPAAPPTPQGGEDPVNVEDYSQYTNALSQIQGQGE
jgi:hypothetical protein